MLSTGCLPAHSTCLRCQLWQAITGPRSLCLRQATHPTPRFLSTSSRRRQEVVAEEVADDLPIRRERSSGGVYHRRIHLNGRIIGRPGRRQRTSSEQLTTASLGKPSEVIVFRDVVEELNAARRFGPRLAEPGELDDIENDETAILGARDAKGETSEETEVIASIEGYRPEHRVLSQEDFDALSKVLAESYDTKQLAQYLLLELGAVSGGLSSPDKKSGDQETVQQVQWQPGKTPLHRRRGLVSLVKGGRGTTKGTAIKKILRLAWHVTTELEEQDIGELEVSVAPWQLSLLFDVVNDGKANVERIIGSPLLLRTSEVQPYRPHNIVRITARRLDCEEIAQTLRKRLAKAGCLDVDLSIFQPMLGRPGWSDDLSTLFREADIQYIASKTNVFIERQGQQLKLHSFDEQGRYDARRMLLALLDLPSVKNTMSAESVSMVESFGKKAIGLCMEEYPALNVHRRYHDTILSRQTVDWQGNREDTAEAWDKLGKKLRSLLHASSILDSLSVFKVPVVPRDPKEVDSTSPWTALVRASEWSVGLCTLVKPSKEERSSSDPPFVQLHSVPGLAQTLSHLKPQLYSRGLAYTSNKFQEGRTYLDVYFKPSPFGPTGLKAMETLPLLQVRYKVDSSAGPDGVTRQTIRDTTVRFTFDARQFDVPMPALAADLSFTRGSTLYQSFRYTDQPSSLVEFGRSLQNSLNSDSAALQAPPGLSLHIPRSLLSEQPGDGTLEVDYMLDRLEHKRSMDYRPSKDANALERMDPTVREQLEAWPETLKLRVTDVEAGAFGGRRTEVTLFHDLIGLQPVSGLARQRFETARLAKELIATAQGVLHMLTRANARELDYFNAKGPVVQNVPADQLTRQAKEGE